MITQDIMISQMVEEYPEVVETLLSYGVHCVGCHVSPVESLGDGLRGHGMDDAKVAEVLAHLNQASITMQQKSLMNQKILLS